MEPQIPSRELSSLGLSKRSPCPHPQAVASQTGVPYPSPQLDHSSPRSRARSYLSVFSWALFRVDIQGVFMAEWTD